MQAKDFFNLAELAAPLASLLDESGPVWEIIARLNDYLAGLFPQQAAIHGQVDAGAILVNSESIYIGPGTHVEAGAYIAGPTYIGANCEVRHGAYLRGGILTGDHCVLGHASEFKNALLLSGSQAGHFAYVGDSILGRRVNLGAGTKLANVEVPGQWQKTHTGQRPTIKIRLPGESQPVDTRLTKMGAILGDDAQTGCNTVTNPGCLIGPQTLIYPNTSLGKGYWGTKKIIKLRQELEIDTLRD